MMITSISKIFLCRSFERTRYRFIKTSGWKPCRLRWGSLLNPFLGMREEK